jgi:hypothetical protein
MCVPSSLAHSQQSENTAAGILEELQAPVDAVDAADWPKQPISPQGASSAS